MKNKNYIQRSGMRMSEEEQKTCFKKGIDYLDQGKYENALKIFGMLLMGEPRNASLHYYKGNTLHKLKRHEEALGEQLEAVYGTNGYYMHEVQDEMLIQLPKSRTSDIASADKSIGISKQGKELDTTSGNTLWHQIRKSLRKELGDHIDEAWFAKAEAIECKETKTLTITMPTRFMADWVKNNYFHVIRKYAIRPQIKNVTYVYST